MPAPGGVNSNLFALLDDDDNEDDAAPVQKAPAANKPAAKKHEDQPKKTEPRERKGKGGDDRRPRGKNDRNDDHSGTYDGSDKPMKPSDGEGRGKGNRRRYDGEGGERKGKGKGARRGREFDRHVSGTGRGKGEQAREGRGRGNWGQAGDEGTAVPTEGATEETTTEKAPEVEPEPEEEENTMTLDEYMASLSAKGPVGGKLEERHIEDNGEGFKVDREADNAGADDGMYGMIFHAYDGKNRDKTGKNEREGWVTADDVLNMKFTDPNAALGGGKGDRDRRGKGGGKKGGGGKGNDRASRQNRGGGARPVQQQQGKIELEDTNAFPSLA